MLRSALLILLTALIAVAQPPPPAFDVASVRVNQDKGGLDQNSPLPEVSADGLTMRRTRLVDVIRWAYNVPGSQVSGPAWVTDLRFDIAAKTSGPTAEAEMRRMLQGLLAERFKLALHRETKEMQALLLTVAKGGLKIKESTGGESNFRAASMTLTGSNVQIGEMTEFLGRILRLPVIDKTGLSGNYNYTMDIRSYITPEVRANMPRDGSPPIEAQGIISSALQEQLGLKIDAAKTPLEMLVIDKIEREPTEN